MAQYQGVDTDNPTIQSYIRNMVKQGRENKDIVRIVGVPHEVVDSVRKRMENEKKGQ